MVISLYAIARVLSVMCRSRLLFVVIEDPLTDGEADDQREDADTDTGGDQIVLGRCPAGAAVAQVIHSHLEEEGEQKVTHADGYEPDQDHDARIRLLFLRVCCIRHDVFPFASCVFRVPTA